MIASKREISPSDNCKMPQTLYSSLLILLLLFQIPREYTVARTSFSLKKKKKKAKLLLKKLNCYSAVEGNNETFLFFYVQYNAH